MLFFGWYFELGSPMGRLYGLLMGSLALNVGGWLDTADAARRGILLQERDCRIAELESELSDTQKERRLDP